MKPLLALLFSLIVPATVLAAPQPVKLIESTIEAAGRQEAVQVPDGFQLELLTNRLNGPRLFTFAPGGELLIGSRSGNLYRLPPPYTDPQVLATLDGYPHSVALRGNDLLVAKTDGLYRAPYHDGTEHIEAGAFTRVAPLPAGSGHNSRSVVIGPDRRIYVSLGISGNCSDQYIGEGYPFDQRRGGVLVLDEGADPPVWRPYAGGLRNPVGIAWRPRDGTLYASNNGPDHLGYDLPPEYFSRLTPDSFHGMPWFQYDGHAIRRDACIERDPPRPAAEVTAPAATFPARNAPMGAAFVPDGAGLKALVGDAVVALHGSWGTRPGGGAYGSAASRRPPALVAVRFEGNRATGVVPLVSGFQRVDGSRWARPVGVGVGPDGALYFTSDGGTNGLFRLRKE
ncbi:PQQ-dependent sugar dehydrogenase [Endothiovibrio diazotrophicus]